MGWYEERIEPGIREVVRLLRDNGVNTESSCEHQMDVQFQIVDAEGIKRVDYILYNAGYRDYLIESFHKRIDGHLYSSASVYFPVNDDYPIQTRRTAAIEQYFMQSS